MTRSIPTRTAFSRSLLLLLALLAFGLLAACGGPLTDALADTEVVTDEIEASDDEVAMGDDASTPMPGEDYSGQDLTDEVFDDQDLSDSDFSNVVAPGASFRFANLTGSRLNGADFTGADFTCADLSNTHLAGTDFTGADFTGAILTGATTPGASFTYDDATFLHTTWTDGTTLMPDASVDCVALKAQ